MALDEEGGDAERCEGRGARSGTTGVSVGEVAEAAVAKLDVPCRVRDCGGGAYKVSLAGSIFPRSGVAVLS